MAARRQRPEILEREYRKSQLMIVRLYEFIASMNINETYGGYIWYQNRYKGISLDSLKDMRHRFKIMDRLVTETIKTLLFDKHIGLENIFLLASGMTEAQQKRYMVLVNPTKIQKDEEGIQGGVKSRQAEDYLLDNFTPGLNITIEEVELASSECPLYNAYWREMRNDQDD